MINQLKKLETFLSAICKSYSIKIKEVSSQENLNEIFCFRYNIYQKHNYVRKSEIKLNRLLDIWDKYSIVIGAYDKEEKIIGTLRLTPADPYSFPSDNIFNAHYPFQLLEALELGKLAVCSKKETPSRIILFALTLKAAITSIKMGYKYWVFSTTKTLKHTFEKLGSTISALNSEHRSISHIKEICSNWRMFKNLDEQYYSLNLSKLDPQPRVFK